MTPARPPVSVVVPTRDRPEQLARCLAALLPQLGPDDEVLVIDSASSEPLALDGTDRVQVRRAELPGASRARNVGWRAARHELVVFTDDDCLPRPGWLETYVDAFTAAGPATTFAWGRVTVAREGSGTAEHGSGGGGPLLAHPGDDVTPLGASCNLAVRRSALVSTGGFDELLGAGTPLRASEDKDLLARLLADGGEGRYVPEAVVEHEVWRSRLALVRLQHHYGIGGGALGVKLERLGQPVPQVFPFALVRTHLRETGQAVRHRWETGVVHGLARATGVLRGRRAARRLRVVDGHLRE